MTRDGRRHKGDTLTVRAVSTIAFTEPAKEVLVEVAQNAVPVLDRGGVTIDTTHRGVGAFVLTLTFQNHWTVQRLQAVKQ